MSLRDFMYFTCPKVDYDVYEEDCVRETVKGYPSCAKVIVEEGDGNRKDDKVGDQQEEHA